MKPKATATNPTPLIGETQENVYTCITYSNMVVLGINGGFRQGYQDVSACLVKEGRLLAAVEEERLNRVKFSPGRLPYLSVLEVLRISNLSIQEVDAVAFHGSTWGNEFEEKLTAYFVQYFGYCPPIKRYHHHNCHAAATYYSSGYERALVLTMDNSGDGVSIQIAVGENGRLQILQRYQRPLSLGVYYSLLTQYCGFLKDSDEYKLMGLAAYGNPDRFDFSWLLDFRDGELFLNLDYVVTVPSLAPSLHRDEMNFNEAFVERMGRSRRLPAEPIADFYKDVAASAQRRLEEVVLQLIRHYSEKTGIRHVCTAGGVALNCLMNQKLMNAPFTDALFVQPASSDAGISLGAAWLAAAEVGDTPVAPEHASWGNEYDNEQIRMALDVCRASYEYVENPAETAADYLAAGKVIGWFQGRMEFGPRALGNRSILANPALPGVQALVNRKIKFRDSFRPFGASVLEEDIHTYFEGKQHQAPYMTVNYSVRSDHRETLSGVTHRDGTCRIQTVNATQNNLYYELLTRLKQKNGHGVCLNTSFNLNHEPIVNTPQQAISSFFGSGLDGLLIGNYLLKK